MSRKTNVLLVTHRSLLSDGLEKLLAGNGRLRLYSATLKEYQNLLPLLYQHGPTVMIVEKELFGEKVVQLTSLLVAYNHLQIIIISSESNDIQVFASYQSVMTGFPNLMAIIQTAARPMSESRGRKTAVFPISSCLFCSTDYFQS